MGLDAGGFGDQDGVAVVGGDQGQAGEDLEDGSAGGPGRGALVAGRPVIISPWGRRALRTCRSTRQKISRARQITVIKAAMRRLVFRNRGATARGPLNSPYRRSTTCWPL